MDTLYMDYENVLIGRAGSIGAYNFYGPKAGGANQQRAISLIKFCIEKILKWDEDQAIKKFDAYMVQLMQLDKVLCYIHWPMEVKYGDIRYLLSLLYPARVKMDQESMAEEIYRTVLTEGKQFPREYFTGADGFYRFCICLKYLIENYKPFNSADEVYDFFLSPAGKRFLYKYRLKVPSDQYGISIIECIRAITGDDAYADLYYSYYDFMERLKILQNKT